MMIFFKELEYMTSLEFEKKLPTKNIDELWACLIKKNIIKYNNKEQFCFDYVGIIAWRESIISINPKYTSLGDNKYSSFKTIFKILKKMYLEKSVERNIFVGSEWAESKKMNSKIYNSILILEDYISNGIYFEEYKLKIINGNGAIDWGDTIDSLDPLVFNGQYIYTEYYTEENMDEEDNFITKLHYFILNDAIEFLRKKEIIDILGYEIDINLRNIIQIEDFIFCAEILKKELEVQFKDSKINTITYMINYLEMKSVSEVDNEMYFYGTRNFKYIWETLCSRVLNNEIKSIEDKYKFETPKWVIDNKEMYNKRNILKPDIMTMCVYEGKKYLLIFDAKYYCMKYEDDKISANPGISDVTKQYLYETICEKYIKENDIDYIYNIFLFPSELETRKVGQVELEFMKSVKIKANQIVLMNINDTEFIEIFSSNKVFNFIKIIKLLKDVR